MFSPIQNFNYNRLSLILIGLIMLLGMLEFLPEKFCLGSLSILFLISIFLIIFSKNSIPIIWLLVAVFYFFPYENVNPLVREAEEYFSIYRRIFGPLNIWEIFLGFSLFAFIIRKLKTGQLYFKGIPQGPWLAILSFLACSFFVGFLHIKGNLLSYGNTDLLRPFVASQAILYMVGIYFITVNSFTQKKQINDTISFIKFLTIALILFGFVKGILILTGNLSTIWPFGLPIILYNQMTFLYLLVFWGVALLFSKNEKKDFNVIWFVCAVFLILTSTRRFNYFILLSGIIATILFVKYFYDDSFFSIIKKMVIPVSLLFVFALLFVLVFPSYLESISSSFQSINIYNLNDAGTNNDIRRAALNNLFLNLSERPYSFFTGFGLGTTWQAIAYQPFDTLFKNVNSEFLMNSMGWYPQFPLPYLNLIFRYGFVGVVLFWSLCLWLIVHFFKILKHVQFENIPKGFILSSLVFVLLFLTSIGDVYNPTAPILVGFLIGLIEAIVEFYAPKRN